MKKLKIKIAQFNTSDIKGGAARASYRLFKGLSKIRNINIKYFVKDKKSTEENIILLQTYNEEITTQINKNYINKLRPQISFNKGTLFTVNLCETSFNNIEEFDIINLHWIENFLSLNNIKELVNFQKPIIWTLHDMKPFTGGCHYSGECDKYLFDCNNCPELINDKFNIAQKVLGLKRTIFEEANITIVSPSKWLANEARKSTLFKKKEIHVIPNSIDKNEFKSLNKNEAKKHFGIDKNTIVLSFGVMNHEERRKGYVELIQIFNILSKKLKDEKIIVLFFGTSTNGGLDLGVNVMNLGYISSNEELSYIYSASDIFILPSLQDNLPNCILEAFSCQTPIISFDTGGAKDLINDSNGIIVPKKDIDKMCDAVLYLIKNKDIREKKGLNARKLIEKYYQPNHQAKKYLELYTNLLSKNIKYKELSSEKVHLPYLDELLKVAMKDDLKDNDFIIDFNNTLSSILKQIKEINSAEETYILYGYGTIANLIYPILKDKIIAIVDVNYKNFDKSINIYSPKDMHKFQYDKVLISVLGRETNIKEYLINEININENVIKFLT